MSEEDLLSNRPSVISLNDVTSQSTFGNTASLEMEKELDKLRNQVRCLENENLGLRRSIPRLRDLSGAEITDEMAKLCAKLAEAEEGIEMWEAECAAKEQMLNRQRQEFFRQIELKENEIHDIGERAKSLEEENYKLRNELENDQSKIYRLINKSGLSEDPTLLDEFHDENIILKLRQDLSEKIAENFVLEEKISELLVKANLKKEQLADLQTVVEQQTRTINAMISASDDVQDLHEKLQIGKDGHCQYRDYSDNDYIVANTLSVLELLNKNECEMGKIRSEIVELLRRYGHNVNENLVNTVNESSCDTFAKRRESIRKRNVWLENEIVNEFGDSMLKHHLDELNTDSIISSLALSNVAPLAPNPEQSAFDASFADIMRNTTAADFLNRTTEVSQDLNNAMNKMKALKNVCNQLFEKLRGTAEFLERVLESLGETEEGRELLAKIMDLKLDLDRSIHEANVMTSGLQKAEKSLAEFRDLMSQTMDSINEPNSLNDSRIDDLTSQNSARNIIDFNPQQPFLQTSQSNNQNSDEVVALRKELQQLYVVKEAYEAMQMTLKNELELKDSLNKQVLRLEVELNKRESEINELSTKIIDLENVADGLHQVLEQKEEDMSEKNRELETMESKKFELLETLNETNQELTKTRDNLAQFEQQYADLLKEIANKEKLFDELNERIDTLGLENFENNKSLENLRREHSELEEQYKLLKRNYRETDAIIGQTNAILYGKISDGFENLPKEESIREDVKDENESLSNIHEFTNFLNDCQERANKIVQLLKKSDEKVREASNILTEQCNASVGLDLQIPFLENLLSESRSIRLMLHKITRFFDSQKENMNRKDEKIMGREIRAELKKIYETLESATDATKLGSKASRKVSSSVVM